MSPTLKRIALLSVAVIASGCDSITGKKDGSFTIDVSDAALSLGQGKQDTVHITITRTDYTKPVTLTVSGAPAGLSVLLAPATVSGTNSDLLLTVSGTAALGLSTLTIKANGEGQTEKSATVDVTIAVTGSFTLSSFGFPMNVAQGGGGAATVLVPRSGGHADNVSLAVTGLPSGVTAAFAASPTSAASTSLTLSVAIGATPGTYNATITGDGAGISQQSTPITFTVITPPTTASLTMPFCPGNTPPWFAYKNDGYPWQVATASGGAITISATNTLSIAYEFTVTSGGRNETDVIVYNATRAEIGAASTAGCAGTKSVTGTVSGFTAGQTASVALGAAIGLATSSAPSFAISGVADGARDLVSTKGAFTIINNGLVSLTPDKLLIQRGLNPASGSSLGTLDFAASGITPATATLSVSNLLAGDSLDIWTQFHTSNGVSSVVHRYTTVSSSASLFSVPAGSLIAGDVHELKVESFQAPNFLIGRLSYDYLGAITDRTVTMPPAVSAPTISNISTSPYTRMRVQLPVQAEYNTATQVLFYQDGGSAADRLIYVVLSAGYLGAVPATWDVSIPEFGTLTGFNNSWMPSSTFLSYQVEGYGGPANVVFNGTPSAGDSFRYGYRVLIAGGAIQAGRFRARPLPANGVRLGNPAQYLRR